MLEIIETVIWIVGAILILAVCISDSKNDGWRAVGFIIGLILVTGMGYIWGNGNPDSLSDNTLYQIENDPFNSTINEGGYQYEYLIITATPITLSSNGSIVKKENEPKYYSVNKDGKKIEQFKKGDIVLNTGDAIVIFKT